MPWSGERSSNGEEVHDDSQPKQLPPSKASHGQLGTALGPQSEEENARDEELVENLVLDRPHNKPDGKEVRKLFKTTFQYRRHWISTDPSPSIAEGNDKFHHLTQPAPKYPIYSVQEKKDHELSAAMA